MSGAVAKLYWKDRHVADIVNVTWLDFPWRIGVLRPLAGGGGAEDGGELERALRRATAVAETDEGEWTDEMFEGDVTGTWWVDEPDGERRYVFAPIYDERDGTVCWR